LWCELRVRGTDTISSDYVAFSAAAAMTIPMNEDATRRSSARYAGRQSMMPKSGYRFSENIMLQQ
jgi:hypothetical protein